MSQAKIITNQYVRIDLDPANITERMTAQIIDLAILISYQIGLLFLYSKIEEWLFTFDYDTYHIIIFILSTLPWLLYSFLTEYFLEGQTLGKRFMHLRVVKIDGKSPSIGDYFLRHLLRLIDIGFSCIGVVAILLTKKGQRLGDLAAQTMVVRQNKFQQIKVSLDEFAYLDPKYSPQYPQAENLTLDQVTLIQHTLNTKDEQERAHYIQKLAKKVCDYLGVEKNKYSDEEFLKTIIKDYQCFTLRLV